jgi:hypothetical protein
MLRANARAKYGGQALFIGGELTENRSGLIVDAPLTRVSGLAERRAALDICNTLPIDPGRSRSAPTAAYNLPRTARLIEAVL